MVESITLRSATIQDADLLLEWRNDLETRKASRNIAKVPMDQHVSWLSRTLINPNRRLLVAEENGSPVGIVRADLSEGIWELYWTVAPKARGRGVGKRMVAIVANQISEPLRAEVKSYNVASARIAEHAGMECDSEADGLLHYIRVQR